MVEVGGDRIEAEIAQQQEETSGIRSTGPADQDAAAFGDQAAGRQMLPKSFDHVLKGYRAA